MRRSWNWFQGFLAMRQRMSIEPEFVRCLGKNIAWGKTQFSAETSTDQFSADQFILRCSHGGNNKYIDSTKGKPEVICGDNAGTRAIKSNHTLDLENLETNHTMRGCPAEMVCHSRPFQRAHG